MDNTSIEQQKVFYDKYWSKEGYLNRLKLLRAIKILEYLSFIKSKIKEPVIVDFGCGDGRFTSFVGQFGPTTGIELSEETVKRANETYKWVKFFQGDCITMDVPIEKFDVVISQEVIEHVWQQSTYLEQCHKMLKPGGFLILTTPNKFTFDAMKNDNWSRQPIENLITYSEVKGLVEGSNFKIIDAETIIFNYGDKGIFRLLNSRYFVGFCNRTGLTWIREKILGKLGFGLHTAILARKNNM